MHHFSTPACTHLATPIPALLININFKFMYFSFFCIAVCVYDFTSVANHGVIMHVAAGASSHQKLVALASLIRTGTFLRRAFFRVAQFGVRKKGRVWHGDVFVSIWN